MNERIREMMDEANQYAVSKYHELNPGVDSTPRVLEIFSEKFAELIVEDCRTVISETYRKTPLELCGPLLTADEEIAKHFYGVEE